MEIRPYVPGNERQILQLFEVAFEKHMSPEFWRWRYQANPFTKDMMIHMMWDGDVLAGHYAVSPVAMVVDGKVAMTALSMTTMTHPSYAGRGIFSTLAESLYTEIKEKFKVGLVWGFPNNNSHYGFIKNLKWHDLATIPFLTLKVKDNKPDIPASYEILTSLTEAHSKKFSNSWASVQIHKSVDFLTWRYLSNPTFEYTVLGLKDSPDAIAIFKIIKSFGNPSCFEVDIVDWTFGNAEEAKQLTLAILDFCSKTGTTVTQINTWESVMSPRHILLEKNGFTLNAPVTFLGARALGGVSAKIYDFRNWDLSMGYSDVF